MEALRSTKEAAEHAKTSLQGEMASLKLEWKVAAKTLKKS
jgi:hypothetical protein